MPYKPTGNPPGRPRKDGTPPKPKAAKSEPEAATEPERNLIVIPGQERPYNLAPICTVCHPDGWPEGWTGTACPHGAWARRI